MARYCVGSVDSSTAVLGSAVHYSPVRYSETVLTSVGTRRRRRRSTHAHNTSAHTTVPPPHTRPMSRHECIPDPPVPGREPAHSARAEDVSPISPVRSRHAPPPSPAPRPDTRVRPPRPRSGRRGRATARSSVASETSCARGRTGRGPARPAVGREGPALGRRRKGNRISYCYGPLTTAIFTRNSYDITHRRSCGASTYEIRVPAAARTAPHKRKQVASAARHENFSNFVGKPARRACVEKYAQVDHSVLS